MRPTTCCHEWSIKDSQAQMHCAVVAEGGGQRGIFTAGVLDAFLRLGFNPFKIGIGTSAGAQNLFTYFIELPGYAKRAIAELSSTPDFFVPYRWLGRRGVMDLDSYFSNMNNADGFQLPYQRISSVRQRRKLMFVATQKSNLEALYLEPDSKNAINYMKASSAIPFLYREGVPFGADILIDGGVADPLPVIKAYELGAQRILVIRTLSDNHGSLSWRQLMDALKWSKALPGNVSDMLERNEKAYTDAMEFIRNPPNDVTIVDLVPTQPLQSSILGSSSSALMSDYESGSKAGEKALEDMYTWQQIITPGMFVDDSVNQKLVA